MRILLDYRPALRQRTGVGAYVHETAAALVASAPADETLTLFSSSWADRLAPDVVPGARTIDRRIPVGLLNLAWHRLGWPPAETIAGGGFDIAQSSHPLLMPARHAARLVTIHDLDYLDHPERVPREIRRDYPSLSAAHARRADQIVVVSGHTASDVERRFGVSPDRISVCPLGAPDWPARPAEPRAGDGCILFLGTIEPRKNVMGLLEAYAALVAARPDAPRLVLAGGHGPDAAPLLQRARDPDLAGRVDVPGYVDEATKRGLYARALVLVLPSHAEGFGLPAVEAMTSGVPVVAARRGALPEVIGPAGRLIDPDVPAELTAALDQILADPAERARLAEAGRAQAATFTWTRTANALRDAWQQALAHREARRG